MRAMLFLVALITAAIDGSQGRSLVYDVTTIYRLQEPLPQSDAKMGYYDKIALNHPATVEVHARTNARGLPFSLHNKTITGPNVGVHLAECVAEEDRCPWTKHNFTWSIIPDGQRLLLSTGNVNLKMNHKWPSYITDFTTFSGNLEFDLEVTEGRLAGSDLRIFLIDSPNDFKNRNMYYMRFANYQELGILYKCGTMTGGEGGEYKHNTHAFNSIALLASFENCEEKIRHTWSFQWNFSMGDVYTISITMADGRILATASRPQATRTLFDWVDAYPIGNISYYAVAAKNFGAIVTPKIKSPLLSLTAETGSMVSPPLPPNLDRVCVSLVYYADKEASIDVLLQQDTTLTPIGAVHTTQGEGKGAWAHQNLIADIPKGSSRETRVVVMATRQLGETLFIQRIAGCNVQEPEDVLMVSEETNLAVYATAADVAHPMTYGFQGSCSNGGIKITVKGDQDSESLMSVCPSGYTGNRCKEACGANSYGADCGGECSMTKRGCRGMILCRPELGCSCAPGFKGFYCDKPCDSGEFGAGCRQRCLDCRDGKCDPYTGICHTGCKPGYIPPYCQQLYMYMSMEPHVTVQDFYNVSVSANFQALLGNGKPRFYQVQYWPKVGHEDFITQPHFLTPQPIPNQKEPQEETHLLRLGKYVGIGHVTGLHPGTTYKLRVVLIDEVIDTYEGDDVPIVEFSTPCTVPQEVDYKYYVNNLDFLSMVTVSEEEFEVEWKFPAGNITWCPVIGYEVHVKTGWTWVKHTEEGNVTRMRVTGLLPGRQYAVKMRAVTANGTATFTPPLVVITVDHNVPGQVVRLVAAPTAERSLKVTWEPPRRQAGIILQYNVTYECLRIGACPKNTDCGGSAGHVQVVTTSALLQGLLPYTVYNISIAALSVSLGRASSVTAATIPSAPDAIPSPATPAVLSSTESSLVVQWSPPDSCHQLNGYITGYRYELVSAEQEAPLVVGTTTDTTAAFNNLEPDKELAVRVYVVNSAGWSSAKALKIEVKTKATSG